MSEHDLPAYLFHQGTNYNAYKFMGAHIENDAAVFRVWAPNADKVFLAADFNGWAFDTHPLERITEGGIWQIYIRPIPQDGCKYKFRIINGSSSHLKADPYAFSSETLSNTASVFRHSLDFEWSDNNWLEARSKTMVCNDANCYPVPINVYELHLGSWKKDGDNYLNYRSISEKLIPYLRKMGYTHVELLPISEHPFDDSWGYQICGYYSPTARFGSPEDFKYFVNALHRSGIGVILDWVPAHFPKDEHGLYEFDGQPLYEFQGADRMEHKAWGTRCFDVGRNEVQSFLISNAFFWFSEYHIDGLRIDAVASMLYLDYDRRPGEWIPNTHGNNHSLEAIAFFRKLNSVVYSQFPDVLMIAEESTAWPLVTRPAHTGGLGFTLKWNMGWANDIFEYIKTDPFYRRYHHSKLTFSMMYAYSENFLLPVSHDEVVYGKGSLIGKMFGNREQKFKGIKAFLCYMMAHPGKKLTFMGCEFGQFDEWDHKKELEWYLLDFDEHRNLLEFTAKLNNFYLDTPQFWEIDFSWEGFRWITADDADNNIIVFERRGTDRLPVICVFNFSGNDICGYSFKTPGGCYKEIFRSDENEPKSHFSFGDTLSVDIPALSAIYLIPCPKDTGIIMLDEH